MKSSNYNNVNSIKDSATNCLFKSSSKLISSVLISSSLSSISLPTITTAATEEYGFTKLPSGLEINDVKVGDGEEAKEGEYVVVCWLFVVM